MGSISYVPLSRAGLKDKLDTLQDKVERFQDKVDTLQDKVDTLQINVDDKLDTFQNTTEASTREHHHEVVELLQNTSCSSEGKIWFCSQALTLQNNGRGWYNYEVHAIKGRHRPDIFRVWFQLDHYLGHQTFLAHCCAIAGSNLNG